MGSYTVYCDECDAGYDVFMEENEIHDKPMFCSYCGSELKDENVSGESSEEDDWEKLIDDEWDSDADSRN